MFNVIDRVPSIDSLSKSGIASSVAASASGSANAPAKLEGSIEFRNVRFEYPTRAGVTVLHNLSFIIKPGQTVAFVGYAFAFCGQQS